MGSWCNEYCGRKWIRRSEFKYIQDRTKIRIREIDICSENVHNIHTHIGIRKTRNTYDSLGPGTKYSFTFLSLRFFDMRRERHTISFYADFFIWPHHVRPPPQTTGLASASFENRLPSSKPKSQLTRSEFKSQLTALYQIPNSSARRFRTWYHSHPRCYFLSGGFIVTSVIVTSALCAREHLHSIWAPN